MPIGLTARGTRREADSMGAIDVPADKYWGAQTQRSLIHFSIGDDKMPKAVYHAYGYVKKAAAIVNGRARRLPAWKADLIERVAREVIAGKLDEHFPLYVADRSGEAMVMVSVQGLSEDGAIAFAGSHGNFELNAMRPVIINNFLHAAPILDARTKLRQYCIDGTQLHRGQIDSYLNRSLMLVTALSPVIGYDKPPPLRTKPTTRARPCAKPTWPPDTSAPRTSTASSTLPPWWALRGDSDA